MQVPSVMKHDFSKVPSVHIQRSSFDRSCGFKTTFNSGYLVPIYVDEVLPGDTFNLRMTIFARLVTLINPIMDNLFLDWSAFFVPNRLVWSNWEKFNGAQDNPGDSVSFLIPQNTAPGGTGYAVQSLQDYFGLPTGNANVVHSQLPLRGYNLIWNTWFRDENLQNSVTVDKGDGPDNPANYVLLRRGKRHDYFTSCLPWAQKGTAVSLPLGTSAPVVGTGKVTGWSDGTNEFGLSMAPTNVQGFTGALNQTLGGQHATGAVGSKDIGVSTVAANSQLIADLTSAANVTINALRQSIALQQFLELDARGGTRYTEILRAHFGVISPDARLQRPEFLGGGSGMIKISVVPQTSSTAAGVTPQANLAAFATGGISRDGFTKSFVEHGYLFIFVNVRADLNYQQGLDRFWSRRVRTDFYWPSFANIGEQAVLNQEIYYQGNGASGDTLVFGYQEPYADYRYQRSKITGQFRSTYATPLDSWHLAQKFTSLPTLNTTFIQDTPPVSRVIAVTSGPELLLDAHFSVKCARPMPVFGVPGLTRL